MHVDYFNIMDGRTRKERLRADNAVYEPLTDPLATAAQINLINQSP